MTHDVKLFEIKSLAQSRQLIHETRNAPKGGVRRTVGSAGTELIINDDRTRLGELREGRQIPATPTTRATMDHHERRLVPGPHDLVPDSPTDYVDKSLLRRRLCRNSTRNAECGEHNAPLPHVHRYCLATSS
jgi:hypothetical protein